MAGLGKPDLSHRGSFSVPPSPPPRTSANGVHAGMVCFVPPRCISFISMLGPPIWPALAEASGQCQAWRGRYRRTAWDLSCSNP